MQRSPSAASLTPEIQNNYEIIKQIGQGAFGSIYKVKRVSDKKIFAMKLTKSKRGPLRLEANFMQKLHNSDYFPKFIEYQESPSAEILIMELLGPSLKELSENITDCKFTLSTSLRVGIEMLRCIRAFHEEGYIHRDIKPSNFLVKNSRKYPLCLIDYGLSRSYIDQKTQEIKKPRAFIGFVGTKRFASINAHEGKDLGRCDDLYSWFLSLLTIMTGKLPWKTFDDNQENIIVKKYSDFEKFCSKLPKEIFQIYCYIMSLTYYDTPNYDLIIALLVKAMEQVHASWNDKYDWELFSAKRINRIFHISLKMDDNDQPNIPQNLPDPSNYKITPIKAPPRSYLMMSKVYSKSTPNIKTDKSSSSSSLRSFGSIGTIHNDQEPLTMSSINDSSSAFDVSDGASDSDSTFTYSSSEDDKRPKLQPSPLKPMRTPMKDRREMLANLPRPDKVLRLTPATPLTLQKAHARFKSQAGNLLAKKGPADSTNSSNVSSYSSVSYDSSSAGEPPIIVNSPLIFTPQKEDINKDTNPINEIKDPQTASKEEDKSITHITPQKNVLEDIQHNPQKEIKEIPTTPPLSIKQQEKPEEQTPKSDDNKQNETIQSDLNQQKEIKEAPLSNSEKEKPETKVSQPEINKQKEIKETPTKEPLKVNEKEAKNNQQKETSKPTKKHSESSDSDSSLDLSSDFSDVSDDLSSDLSSDDNEVEKPKPPLPKKKVPIDPKIKDAGNRKLNTIIKKPHPKPHSKSGLWAQNCLKAVLV